MKKHWLWAIVVVLSLVVGLLLWARIDEYLDRRWCEEGGARWVNGRCEGAVRLRAFIRSGD